MRPHRRRFAIATFAVTSLLALAGCGTETRKSQSASSTSLPAYVTESFTHEQELIQQGGGLVVTDGCSACHLETRGRKIAPSFAGFAGHRVTLADGRRVLVDERLIREGLLHPKKVQIKGYDPAQMLAAVKRLDLAHHPQQVAALAAFIEQIGPEPG